MRGQSESGHHVFATLGGRSSASPDYIIREISGTMVVSKAPGALCALRSGLHRGKSCKTFAKASSEASRRQIQLLREISCTMVVSKASGALCAPRWGCHGWVRNVLKKFQPLPRQPDLGAQSAPEAFDTTSMEEILCRS